MSSGGSESPGIRKLRQAGGDALVRRMTRLFLILGDDAMERIDAGFARATLPVVQAAAHHLFSSAAQLQFEELANAAQRVDAGARNDDVTAVGAALPQLRSAFAEARAEVQAVLAELPHAPRAAIVDDSEDVRVLLRFVLEPHFEVTEYDSGGSALRGLRRFPADIVIIDISLPDISGVDLLNFMREDPQLARIPTVALTAYNVDSYSDLGFDLELRKPISNTDDFVRSLQQILRA